MDDQSSNYYLYVRLSDIIKKHDFEISGKLDLSEDRVTLTISGENDLPTTYLPFNPQSIGSSASFIIDINRRNYKFLAILKAPWAFEERFENSE